MAVRFLILGPPEVRGDSGTVPLIEPAARTLLTALAVSANTPIPTRRLVEAMWGRPRGRAGLRFGSAVAALRRVLHAADEEAACRLVRHGDEHMLVVEPDELDLDRFTLLVRHGRAALDAGDHHGAAVLLDGALAIWRGAAGERCAAYAWLGDRLSEIERLRASAAEARLVARLTLDQPAGAYAEEFGLLSDPVRDLIRLALPPYRRPVAG